MFDRWIRSNSRPSTDLELRSLLPVPWWIDVQDPLEVAVLLVSGIVVATEQQPDGLDLEVLHLAPCALQPITRVET